ncbi:hypothetical protein AB3X96_27490 [Paraburkholderia sp. BR13439]|uniref:hypothetical protein n=1 Tax=Paraburkholderia TaxID=1822464 RepID=UPI0034CE9F77
MLRTSRLADYVTVITITMARDPDTVESIGSLADARLSAIGYGSRQADHAV